jgi:hypothetical protein
MTINEVIREIRSRQEELQITLYPRVPESSIDNFEQELSIKLPSDVKTFYRFSNGMEAEADLFRIIPLDEILDGMRSSCADRFYIAEYMVYSDIWVMQVNPDDHNDYTIFNIDKDNEQLSLTRSFAGFIQRWLKGGVFGAGGLYDWHKEVKKK